MTDLVTLIGTSLPRAVARWYPDVTWRVPTDERVAFLTFDDGPHPGLTDRIASVLDRHDGRASFFLLGSKAQRHPSLVRGLVDAGHTAGNHTFSHFDAWRADPSSVLDDLEHATDILETIAGTNISWMRPPYGRFTRSMRNWCRHRRQTMTMWDVGTGDYLQRVTGEHVLRHVETYIRPGSVIVLHDNPCCADTTPEALDRLLERMMGQGWRFEALSTRT